MTPERVLERRAGTRWAIARSSRRRRLRPQPTRIEAVARTVAALCVLVLLVAGCVTAHQPAAVEKIVKSRWLLIRNPGFGKILDEPEYVWVRADEVPVTMTTLTRGKAAIIATPEIAARYGPPPSDNTISPRNFRTSPQGPVPRCDFRRKTRVPVIHPVTGEVLGELEDEAKPGPCRPDD